MKIDDKFAFGQYKGLSLLEVYRGTASIDKTLLKEYLNRCLQVNIVPKPPIFEFCELLVTEDEMLVFPQIFNEEEPESLTNVVSIGEVSGELEIYFNSFFRKSLYGTFETLEHFNYNNFRKVIGGDPDYLDWCSENIEGFSISQEVKERLEMLPINRFKGILVKQVDIDRYSYSQKTDQEFYKFR